jgi:hypothetical protein
VIGSLTDWWPLVWFGSISPLGPDAGDSGLNNNPGYLTDGLSPPHRPRSGAHWAERQFVYMTTAQLPVAPHRLLVAMELRWLDDVVAA